jgi:hypothetical protein
MCLILQTLFLTTCYLHKEVNRTEPSSPFPSVPRDQADTDCDIVAQSNSMRE